MRNVNLLRETQNAKRIIGAEKRMLASVDVNIEELFGIPAGKVYRCLFDHGETNFNDIAKLTGLKTKEICFALGWLGREGKLSAKRQGRITTFSLI